MKQAMIEDIRTTVVGVIGLATQYADIDFIIKLLVGLATLTYLVIRIMKLLRGDKMDKED